MSFLLTQQNKSNIISLVLLLLKVLYNSTIILYTFEKAMSTGFVKNFAEVFIELMLCLRKMLKGSFKTVLILKHYPETEPELKGGDVL